MIVINVPIPNSEGSEKHTVNHYLYQMVSATIAKVLTTDVYTRMKGSLHSWPMGLCSLGATCISNEGVKYQLLQDRWLL